jgi:hypothetical protein
MKESDCLYHARGDERRSLMVIPMLDGSLRFVGTHDVDRADVETLVDSLKQWLATGSLVTPAIAAQ